MILFIQHDVVITKIFLINCETLKVGKTSSPCIFLIIFARNSLNFSKVTTRFDSKYST